MIKEELNKVIDLQEEFGNPFIVIHKPKAKEKITIFDSDTAVFDIVENELIFDFWEIKGFKTKLDKIKSILFEKFSEEMTIVHIGLKNKNSIMLHFMNN
jgi:hypothetical protein